MPSIVPSYKQEVSDASEHLETKIFLAGSSSTTSRGGGISPGGLFGAQTRGSGQTDSLPNDRAHGEEKLRRAKERAKERKIRKREVGEVFRESADILRLGALLLLQCCKRRGTGTLRSVRVRADRSHGCSKVLKMKIRLTS